MDSKFQTYLYLLAFILIIAGALNWFSIGVYDFNIVDYYLPEYKNYVYILVGLSAFVMIYYKIMLYGMKKSMKSMKTTV